MRVTTCKMLAIMTFLKILRHKTKLHDDDDVKKKSEIEIERARTET